MERQYYTFLQDRTELDRFISTLRSVVTLEKDETMFIGLMSRNKYLTDDEKKTIDLGRANLVTRQIIDELTTDKVIRALAKMECAYGAYLDRSGNPIPEKCLIPYFSFNPVSPIKAFADTQRCFIEYLLELEARHGDKENTYSRLQRLDRQYFTQLQHAFSRKLLLDIDFDIPDRNFGFELTDTFMKKLADSGANSFRIMTRGGFHILVDRDTIKYNYTKDLEDVRKLASLRYDIDDKEWEIETNPNEGIPLPGCMQKDHLIRVTGETNSTWAY